MKCSEFDSYFKEYMDGKMDETKKEVFERHLENCATCQAKFDAHVERQEERVELSSAKLFGESSQWHELDEKKQKRILIRAKYRNRLSVAVTVLLLFFVLYAGGSILSSIYFTARGENSSVVKTQKTASMLTELAFPNVTMPAVMSMPSGGLPMFTTRGWGHSRIDIKPYFIALGEYALERKVGKDTRTIGKLHINHLLGLKAVQWAWQDDYHEFYLYFYHPQQLKNMGVMNIEQLSVQDATAWETLEIIPDGTVAEMAVSFKEELTIQEVMALFKEYDFEVTWYAVSTGREGLVEEDVHENRPLSAFSGAWGVPNYSRNMLYLYNSVADNDSNLRETYFIDALEYLADNEKIAEKIYRGDPADLELTSRLAYVKEHGIQVYGAVITGPTKELLTLRDLAIIHSPAIGEIELWNWFQRSFSGTMY